MKNKMLKALVLSAVITCFNGQSFASENNEDAQIQNIKEQIQELKNSSDDSYDVEAAVASLYEKIREIEKENDNQLEILRNELTREQEKNAEYEKEKQESREKIEKYLNKVKEKKIEPEKPNEDEREPESQPQIKYNNPKKPTNEFLIEPTASSMQGGYIQDAANAQGYARMEFSYAPQQVYKIYCKIGYLTDLEFKQGEKITYVGGGDTAQWLIDNAMVDGTPHLYIKPIANNVATNIIVNTDKGHVYQILLNSGNWYNPMISWNYGNEDSVKGSSEMFSADKALTVQPENINFNYTISNKKDKKGKLPSWAPVSVFDDGNKTYIKFINFDNKIPILFIKEKNSKDIVLANYRIKNNTFIIDKIFDEAQMQISNNEQDIVIIKRN